MSSLQTDHGYLAANDPTLVEPQRWAALAVLRLFLAMGVMFLHIGILDLDWGLARYPYLLADQIYGNILVGSFFFISGFSIAQSCTRHSTKAFYKRRFWRIYPLYWFALCLSLVPFLIWGPQLQIGPKYEIVAPTLRVFALNAFMLQMIYGVVILSFAPAWSLGIEEVYYFAAPLVRKLPRFALLVLIVASAVYFRRTFGDESWSHGGGIGIAGLFWMWLIGWTYSLYPKDNWIRFLLLVLTVNTLAGLPRANAEGLTTTVLTLFLITCVFKIRFPRWVKKVCAFAGDLSFEIYALHFPLICILRPLTHSRNPWLYAGCILAASIAVLVLLDRPLRRRGYSRAQSRTESAFSPIVEAAPKSLPDHATA